MIVNDREAAERLQSPHNLINRMKDLSGQRKNAMSLFIRPEPAEPTSINSLPKASEELIKVPIPIQPEQNAPTSDDIIANGDDQIKLGLAHDNAIKLLNSSIDMLSAKLDNVSASKLPSVIAAASRTIEGIRKERNEQNKNNGNRDVHYHFYTPQQRVIADYEVIEVGS